MCYTWFERKSYKESQTEEIAENDQETEESETESISVCRQQRAEAEKVSLKCVGLLHEGAWWKESVVWIVQE